MTDTEILQSLRNNKYSSALKGLYNILPSVKSYVKANNGSSYDAEDVFQDALVILYKKVQADDLKLTVPLKTYILAVVRNCWQQQLRQRKKFPVAIITNDIVDEKFEHEGDALLATAAFNLLGEKCRQLLIHFYYNKKSFKEIAGILAFSDEKTAKNQKYRCIQKAKDNFLTLSKNTNE